MSDLIRQAARLLGYFGFLILAVVAGLRGHYVEALLCLVVLGLMDVEAAIDRAGRNS